MTGLELDNFGRYPPQSCCALTSGGGRSWLGRIRPVCAGVCARAVVVVVCGGGNVAIADDLRAYLLQCRQETGVRLAEMVCKDSEKPSKWWMCFTKRRFLGKSLEGPGAHVGGSVRGSTYT